MTASRTTREWLRIEAPDGVVVALEHVPALAPAVGVCVAGHAMMTSSRSLDRPHRRGLASTLAESGLEVYLLDLRGHGRSRAPGLDWSYDQIVRRDLPAVARALHARHPDLGVGALGHSLTGTAFLAQMGTCEPEDRFDAVVTLNTNIWLASLDPSRVRRLQKRLLCEAMGAVSAVVGELPARKLRIGTENVSKAFSRDLLRWSRTGAWTTPTGEDYIGGLRGQATPVLALQAAGDRLFCHPTAGIAFHERLELAALEIREVEWIDGGHVPGHMDLVLDSRSVSIWREIGRWLIAALAPQRQWGASSASL